MEYEKFKKLDSNSFKSITILKDASATDLYGKAAENGVIVISSKDEAKEMSNQFRLENFSGKDAPLFIIDGKRTNAKAVNKISSDDIESITVLKDKTALEKYGRKAKNGVVEIHLKK